MWSGGLLWMALVVLLGALEAELCRRYSFSNRPSFECTNAHLKEPPNIPEDVVAVTLFNNSMRSIERFPPSYSSVFSLQMQYCGIEKISPQTLSSLRSLKSLDLSHNGLSSIVFSSSLASLVSLSLAHNNLRFLPDMSMLTNLRRLDISFNSLYRINPRSLPPNVQSIRMGHNRVSALTPWPHLNQLQELDVSSNPLQCECSLWEWVAWANRRSLIDPSMLPCDPPISYRELKDNHENLCGPLIQSSDEIDQMEMSLGEPAVLCCMISSVPSPSLHWMYGDTVIGKGITRRNLPDTGRIRYCLEIFSLELSDYGNYSCVATLGERNASKTFKLERHKEPLVLKNDGNFLFYVQFSVVLFLIVFCISSYCIITKDRFASKTEDMYSNQHIVQIMVDNEYDKPLDYLDDTDEWGSPWMPKAVYSYIPGSGTAPLARFDPDSKSIMGVNSTAL